jgi:hypothetical protein
MALTDKWLCKSFYFTCYFCTVSSICTDIPAGMSVLSFTQSNSGTNKHFLLSQLGCQFAPKIITPQESGVSSNGIVPIGPGGLLGDHKLKEPPRCVPSDLGNDSAHLWSTPWASFRSVTIGTGTYGAHHRETHRPAQA